MEKLNLTPLCDYECQRKKKIANLKTQLDQADPSNKYSAYVDYNSYAKGSGWASAQKDSDAKRDAGLRIEAYLKKWQELQEEHEKHSSLSSLAQGLQENTTSTSEDVKILRKQLRHEKDKKEVLDRLNELGVPEITQANVSDGWYPYILDGIIVFLGLVLVYLGWTKYQLYITRTAKNVAEQGLNSVREGYDAIQRGIVDTTQQGVSNTQQLLSSISP